MSYTLFKVLMSKASNVYIFNLTWAKHVVWVIFITWHPSSMSSSHFNLLFISQTARPNISQIWLECLLHGPLWKLYNFDRFRNPKWLPMHQHRPPFQNVPKRMFYVLSSPDLKGHMSFSYDLVFVVLNFKKKIFTSEITVSIWFKVACFILLTVIASKSMFHDLANLPTWLLWLFIEHRGEMIYKIHVHQIQTLKIIQAKCLHISVSRPANC